MIYPFKGFEKKTLIKVVKLGLVHRYRVQYTFIPLISKVLVSSPTNDFIRIKAINIVGQIGVVMGKA